MSGFSAAKHVECFIESLFTTAKLFFWIENNQVDNINTKIFDIVILKKKCSE